MEIDISNRFPQIPRIWLPAIKSKARKIKLICADRIIVWDDERKNK